MKIIDQRFVAGFGFDFAQPPFDFAQADDGALRVANTPYENNSWESKDTKRVL